MCHDAGGMAKFVEDFRCLQEILDKNIPLLVDQVTASSSLSWASKVARSRFGIRVSRLYSLVSRGFLGDSWWDTAKAIPRYIQAMLLGFIR